MKIVESWEDHKLNIYAIVRHSKKTKKVKEKRTKYCGWVMVNCFDGFPGCRLFLRCYPPSQSGAAIGDQSFYGHTSTTVFIASSPGHSGSGIGGVKILQQRIGTETREIPR